MPEKQYLCPVEALVDIIGGKWKIPILALLSQGTKRYAEIRQQNSIFEWPINIGVYNL